MARNLAAANHRARASTHPLHFLSDGNVRLPRRGRSLGPQLPLIRALGRPSCRGRSRLPLRAARVAPLSRRGASVVAMAEKKKLWGGRFSEDIDPLMEKFNESLSFDCRMAQEDIRGSMGYARALAKTGIITDAERDELIEGLGKVGEEWAADAFEVKDGDEDIHTANERRLGEIIGSVAGKLHTGRSRNDQVATDTRMWLRSQLLLLRGYLRQLIAVAVERAEKEVDVVMPGFTHLQSAQTVRWSHWLSLTRRRGSATTCASPTSCLASTPSPRQRRPRRQSLRRGSPDPRL